MLEAEALEVAFPGPGGWTTVAGPVDLALGEREGLGLVGESGSGKTVTALALAGLLPAGRSRVRARRLAFGGRDLLAFGPADWRALRGRDIAMVFQDPMSSLNPLMRCGEQIAESLRLHQGLGRKEARAAATGWLERMGIPDPERRYRSYPFELSGGMRQRVMIAMALACRPRLLIADEPTTALDATVQAQILDLIRSLRAELGMAMILITHDLGAVRRMVERLLVLYAGRTAETGPTAEVLARPAHPYTRALLASIPDLGRPRARLQAIEGVVPPPDAFPAGCRFHPRCPWSVAACREGQPPLAGEGGRAAACVRAGEIGDLPSGP